MKEETFLFFLPFIVPEQGIFKMVPLISFLGSRLIIKYCWIVMYLNIVEA